MKPAARIITVLTTAALLAGTGCAGTNGSSTQGSSGASGEISNVSSQLSDISATEQQSSKATSEVSETASGEISNVSSQLSDISATEQQSSRASSEASEAASSSPEKASLTEEGPAESSQEGLTSEELEQLEIASKKLEEFCRTEEYMNADFEQKRDMALGYLGELADEGLIIKQSILAYDDTISFRYSSGVYGGIKLHGFDPMYN